jgi:hypothetical protein
MRLEMKKRFYFTVLVLAVILLALPGLTGKGVRRVTRHRRRFAQRLPGPIASTSASRLSP